jgi:hypothetical protein
LNKRPKIKNIVTIEYVRKMLLKDKYFLPFSLYSLLSNTSRSDLENDSEQSSLEKNLKQSLCNDDNLEKILIKLESLFGTKEAEMMMIKHEKELEKIKKKIEEIKNLINKIFTERKKKERLESLMKILEIIPSNDEFDEDIFYLDVVLSFIYEEVWEIRLTENIFVSATNKFDRISTFFEDLLKRFNSYQKKHHKLLMMIIFLLGIEYSNIPSIKFDFFPLILKLFNNNNEEILMKKFQYPILKAIFNVINDLNVEKRNYIFSELFKNKISILLPHIFGNDVLINRIVIRIVDYLGKDEKIAKVKNGVIEDILSVIDIEVKNEKSENNFEEEMIGVDYEVLDFVNFINLFGLKLDFGKRFSKLLVIFVLLKTLDKLLSVMKKLKLVNHEHVLSLFKVLLIYFSNVDSFSSLSSVVSLTLHYHLLDINERSKNVVLMIASVLLKYLKIALKNLDEMKHINCYFYNVRGWFFDIIPTAFELLKGVVNVFSVFEMHKHKKTVFYLDFFFTEYNSMHINVRIANFIKKLLKDGKLIIFMSICQEIFKLRYFEHLTDFYPIVVYSFILKRTINPNMCYDNCDFPSFLNKYPSNFMTNLEISFYCDVNLEFINNPLIIILKCLFSERKRREWIEVDDLKLLIEIFSDVNEDYLLTEIITAKECDEISEKGYLDDVIGFILEGRRMEKEKRKFI